MPKEILTTVPDDFTPEQIEEVRKGGERERDYIIQDKEFWARMGKK